MNVLLGLATPGERHLVLIYQCYVHMVVQSHGHSLFACRVPEVGSVYLNMPNVHFVPIDPPKSTFEDDVYVATGEPHGNIEAVVTRQSVAPHCRL